MLTLTATVQTFIDMNVLSLFDGMSCGQQALERAGIKVDNYYASEIDKYAIQVTMANYPNTIQLGSVINVDGYSLPKIDLLIGGSPCQSFSFAGKRKGMSTKDEQEILTLEHYLQLKNEGFEFEGQSYLFWEYMRLLNEIKPKYFLLENVMMGEKWEKILSKAIGVNAIEINSALVSAQNRRRLYWTNIGLEPNGLFGDLESIILQPKDKGILLKDILQDNPNAKYYLSENQYNKTLNKTGVNPNINEAKILDVYNNKIKEDGKSITLTDPCHNNLRLIEPIIIDEKYYISDAMINRINRSNNAEKCFTTNDKSLCLAARYYKQGRDNQYIVHNTMPRSSKTGKGGTGPLSRNDGKTYCLDTGFTNAIEIIGLTEVRTDEAKKTRKATGTNPKRAKELVERNDGKTGALLTSLTNDNLIKINELEIIGGDFRYDEGFRWRENGKSPTLCLGSENGLSGNALAKINNSRIRRLTPIECERLQTVKDNYTNFVSDSQRYKMLGNGWTIDVIVHILNYII